MSISGNSQFHPPTVAPNMPASAALHNTGARLLGWQGDALDKLRLYHYRTEGFNNGSPELSLNARGIAIREHFGALSKM